MKEKSPLTLFLVGGGSGGHALPLWNIFKALEKKFNAKSSPLAFHIFGRGKGIEKTLFQTEAVSYQVIPSGKLRRAPLWQWKNLQDLFRVGMAFGLALRTFWRHRRGRGVVFSTGGYVALPVILAAACFRLPLLLHEQTTRIGLTNRIGALFASKILLNFEAAKPYFPAKKTVVVGYPLRAEFYSPPPKENPSRQKRSLKKILFAGGGNGSRLINTLVRQHLSSLLERHEVVHQTGALAAQAHAAQRLPTRYKNRYRSFSFAHSAEWVKLLRDAEVVVTRSGAGIASECLFLGKKTLFIPLAIAQQSEQLHNARAVQQKLRRRGGRCEILLESQLKQTNFLRLIETLAEAPSKGKAAATPEKKTATEKIALIIKQSFKG